MKKLTLLRHAKSSWAEPISADFARPLNDRGRRAALAMSRHMAECEIFPDVVLCSSAVRTRQTFEGIVPHLKRPREARIIETLYHASPGVMLSEINVLPAAYQHVLVIAHNPGLELLARELADEKQSDAEALAALKHKYPTAGLACYEFDVEAWADIAPGAGRLTSFTTPKSLGVR